MIVYSVLCSGVAERIGKPKGHGYSWLLGFLLGMIGVIIVACLPWTEEARIEAAEQDLRVQREAARRVAEEELNVGPPRWPDKPA